MGYAISGEVQGDWIREVDGSRGSDIEPSIDKELTVRPADGISLVSVITTESVLDREIGEDWAFKGIGTYVNSLYADAEFETLRIRGGKFDPDFGLATQRLDGIYATDLLGDYDNDERLGAEGVLHFEALGLPHTVTASAFTTDRTVLSESIFTKRGRVRLSDGGAGNSEGISSVVLVLDGCVGAETPDCFEDGSFGYRLGFRHQEAGHATEEQIEDEITPKDENAYLATLTSRLDLDPVILRLLGEGAYVTHLEDGPDDAWYATASASFAVEPVTFMATYTAKRNLVDGEADTTEHLVDLTAAYVIGEEQSFAGEIWTLAAGYRYFRNDEGDVDHTVGLKLTVDLEGTLIGSEASKAEEPGPSEPSLRHTREHQRQ